MYKRQVLALQEYNFSWEYIKGSENIVADTLSRMDPEGNKTGKELREIEIFRLGQEVFHEELADIKKMQRSDVKLGRVIHAIESDPGTVKLNQHFQIYKGIFFKKVEGEN